MRDLSFTRRLLCPGTDAAVATDAAVKGGTDAAAAAGTAADVGAAAATAGEIGAGIAGAGAADAALAGGTAAALPEVTVLGATPVGAGLGLGDVAAGIGGLGAISSLGAASPSTPGAGSGAKTSFLPATSATSATPLSSDMATSFGIDSTSAPTPAALSQSFPGGTGGLDTSVTGEDLSAYMEPDSAAPDTGGGFGDWFKSPKNLATAGLLTESMVSALSRPKLPGAAQTALSAAGPDVARAENIIKSGGTATPIWSQQKASIDAAINQQIQQQSESMLQSAINNGMGDKDSPVVQQMLAKMKSDLETQRQELYLQAQQQNVNNAIAELTGDNQVLGNIAQIQLSQSQEAQQAASQTAELALLLQSLKG